MFGAYELETLQREKDRIYSKYGHLIDEQRRNFEEIVADGNRVMQERARLCAIAEADEKIRIQEMEELREREHKARREREERISDSYYRDTSYHKAMEDAMARVNQSIAFSEAIHIESLKRYPCATNPPQQSSHSVEEPPTLVLDNDYDSDSWKNVKINQVLCEENILRVFGMINSGSTFMEVSDYTRTLIERALGGELFRYNEIMREKSEMSSRHMQELGDYQPQHQSSAPHTGEDELPPMPLSLYERFKKERDSLDIDKENGVAVRKLSKGAA